MRTKNLPFIALGLINLSCAVFHAVFQLDLLADTGMYRGFILIENALITVIFVAFAAVLLCGNPVQKRMALNASILFWSFFLLAVVAVQPVVTSLSIIESLLFMPQHYYLLVFGISALALSLLGRKQLKQTP